MNKKALFNIFLTIGIIVILIFSYFISPASLQKTKTSAVTNEHENEKLDKGNFRNESKSDGITIRIFGKDVTTGQDETNEVDEQDLLEEKDETGETVDRQNHSLGGTAKKNTYQSPSSGKVTKKNPQNISTGKKTTAPSNPSKGIEKDEPNDNKNSSGTGSDVPSAGSDDGMQAHPMEDMII